MSPNPMLGWARQFDKTRTVGTASTFQCQPWNFSFLYVTGQFKANNFVLNPIRDTTDIGQLSELEQSEELISESPGTEYSKYEATCQWKKTGVKHTQQNLSASAHQIL